jgi:hypothetical protein
MFQQKQTHRLSEGKQVISFTAASILTVLEVDHPCGKYKRLLLWKVFLNFCLFLTEKKIKILHNYYLFNGHWLKIQSPSTDANIFTCGQEIPCVPWNQTVYCNRHNSPLMVHNSNNINPVHILSPPPPPITWKSIWMLYTHLHLGFQSILLPSSVTYKTTHFKMKCRLLSSSMNQLTELFRSHSCDYYGYSLMQHDTLQHLANCTGNIRHQNQGTELL